MTEGTCKSCGSPLTQMEWNSVTDVFVCDNYQCGFFRRPIDTVGQITKTKKVEAHREEHFRLPEWLGGPYDTKADEITTRLQELRQKISTQEEDSKIL